MSIFKNSEILFLYDAKLSNPNGDMDNENKPRMDYDTDTNLVSDVRLKRYIRDYFETVKNKEIFVTEKAAKAEERSKQMKADGLEYTDLIDVRLFGAVLATKGGNDHITGPIQFNWGYSLNPVEINESSTITSSFSSGEGVGKDFRVKYSFLAFSGGVNALTAKDSKLNEEDLSEFDKAIVQAIPFARTRSKIGQTPRLYLRVELIDNQKILKDLREYLTLDYTADNKYAVRSVADFALNIRKLTPYLEKQPIAKIYYWLDDTIEINGWNEFIERFTGKLQQITF
ncbi:MAG: type I-B CRISPR-associated protein Cas7/Csh2 [Anaerolineales bacterium]|nr:type I-B CRISPR-associated protein Cas7/Csh2 [Anaerolineales bacterium]